MRGKEIGMHDMALLVVHLARNGVRAYANQIIDSEVSANRFGQFEVLYVDNCIC